PLDTMNLFSRCQPKQPEKPMSFSLIDIGRDTVKVAIVLALPDRDEPHVVGYGLAETGDHDVAGGRLEAAAVVGPVNQALIQAEDSTEAVMGQKIVPDHAIFALTGRATTGTIFTAEQSRNRPKKPITARELKQLQSRADRLARQGLAQLPIEGGHWEPLAVNDAGLRIDDHLVLDAIGLTGRHLSLSLFGMAGQSGALRALEVVANRLDLIIDVVIAAPQALAFIAPDSEAIVLDIGLASTDICLIKDDALVGTASVPFGGKFFTQVLAELFEIDRSEARVLKHAWYNDELDSEDIDRLKKALESAYQRWHEAVMNALFELSPRQPLPWKLFFTGGGSLLPGLDYRFKSDPYPFSRAPEITRLGEGAVTTKDLTESIDYNLFMLALSLTVGLPE
ncbi:MAG: cell division FtsA domain-containing protein, partial [Chloroflexota bacterium]